MPHLIYILFVFALGSCVGSFLNVVVWRTPRIEHAENEGLVRGFFTTLKGLSEPPSHCPNCNRTLKWYDNIPVIGWIKLGGKCRFCKAPFSIRYPIVEAVTGLMFVGYYLAFFVYQIGPALNVTSAGALQHHHLFINHEAWLYGLDMALLSALLAASLIDAELFIIPIEIPWAVVPFAIAIHSIFDRFDGPGNVAAGPAGCALAVGATAGTALSITLIHYNILLRSFAQGDPLLDVERKRLEEERLAEEKRQEKKDRKRKKGGGGPEQKSSVEMQSPEAEREWSPGEIRREIGREMLFLVPPLAIGMLCVILVLRVDAVGYWWANITRQIWVAGLLGSILGGLVGGFTVWLTRILGSLGFGRQAMGMGDVDLMVAVGAVLGVGPVIVAFFVAPFFGIALSIYLLILRKSHELPYGPYLSLATAFVMLFYGPIAAYFTPGLNNAVWLIGRLVGGG